MSLTDDLNTRLTQKLQSQIGGLTFELCLRDAKIELLEAENQQLKQELAAVRKSDHPEPPLKNPVLSPALKEASNNGLPR